MNERISYIREQIAVKESIILSEKTSKELELKPGQAIWHQDSQSKKWSSGWIKENDYSNLGWSCNFNTTASLPEASAIGPATSSQEIHFYPA